MLELPVEILRPLWVVPLNFLGDCLRYMIGVGPEWRMHHRLARRLVDRGSWFMIPLASGTQSPIFDAIEYLAKVEGRDALPRLEALFAKYVGDRQTTHRERLSYGMVTYLYGPQDYMPLHVLYVTAKTIIGQMRAWEDMPVFVEKYLGEGYAHRLGESTLRELFSVAIRYRLPIDPTVLRKAFLHLERLSREQAERDERSRRREPDHTPVRLTGNIG